MPIILDVQQAELISGNSGSQENWLLRFIQDKIIFRTKENPKIKWNE